MEQDRQILVPSLEVGRDTMAALIREATLTHHPPMLTGHRSGETSPASLAGC